MANEWKKVELYGANNDGEPRRYTIADGVNVSKGTLLRLIDTREASAALVHQCPLAGVAAHDKEKGDDSTTIACWTNGVFEATASAAILIGGAFGADAAGAAGTENQIVPSTGAVPASGSCIGGYALEAIGAGETANVRLKL